MWLLIQVANVPINDKRLKNIHLCLFMIPMCNQGKKKVLTLVCLQSQIIQNIEVPLSLAHLKKDAETLFWPQMTQFWLQLPSRQWHDLRNLGHARITSSRPRHCRGGEMMRPATCLQQMQMSLEMGRDIMLWRKLPTYNGSGNLWPRKGSRACERVGRRNVGTRFEEELCPALPISLKEWSLT